MYEQQIYFKGLDLLVRYDFTPGEPQVRYYNDGSGYPGSPDEYEVHEIIYEGTNIEPVIYEIAPNAIELITEELTCHE